MIKWIRNFFASYRGLRMLGQPVKFSVVQSFHRAEWLRKNKDQVARTELRNAAITRARVEAFNTWSRERQNERVAFYEQKILAERGETQ